MKGQRSRCSCRPRTSRSKASVHEVAGGALPSRQTPTSSSDRLLARIAEYSRRRGCPAGEATASGSSSSVPGKGRVLSDFRNRRRARPHRAGASRSCLPSAPALPTLPELCNSSANGPSRAPPLLGRNPGPLYRSHGPGRRAGADDLPSAGRHQGNGVAFSWQTVRGGGRAPVSR